MAILKEYEGLKEWFKNLRRILQGGDDAALAGITEDVLPDVMLKLKGVRQNPVHGGLDPLEHTFRMLSLLDTNSLRHPELAKAASVFHDIGKLHGAESGRDFFEHPKRSADMVQPFLEKMGYSPWEVDVIKQLIRNLA